MAVLKTDVDSLEENVEIEDIGPEKKGESKGRMDFPDRARNLAVARSAMDKHGYSAIPGIPKKWKGRSGYFFEVISPGEIKITGGDTTETLTGGRSHIMKDPARIAKVIENSRRPGSIVEVGAEYQETESAPAAAPRRRAAPAPAPAARLEGRAPAPAQAEHDALKSEDAPEPPEEAPKPPAPAIPGRSEFDVTKEKITAVADSDAVPGIEEIGRRQSETIEEPLNLGESEPLNLGESEADEFVLTLREMGYSEELIDSIPANLRAHFLRLAKGARK